jgi:hypothetical protein
LMCNIDDLYRKYSVKVNNGSGCLFQPDVSALNDSDFTYVLTAKHNLQNEDKTEVFSKKEIKVYRGSEESPENELEVKAVYPHADENKDAAILKVSPVKDDIRVCYTSCNRHDSVRFFGYPNRKSDEDIKTDSYDCEVHDKTQDKRIVIEPGIPFDTYDGNAHDNVKGFSGCGVFKEAQRDILLVGILSRLADATGAGGKILVLPIDYFNEIISKYNLPPLIPNHLTSFEEYKDKIWTDYDSSLHGAKNLLKESADEIIKRKITPILISHVLSGKLCLPHNMTGVNDDKLWSGWLEMLTYSKIDKEGKAPIEDLELDEMKYFEKLRKNICFFYNNSVNDWISLVRKVFDLDLRELNKGASIIINTVGERTPPKTKINTNRIIREIDQDPISRSKMRIDKGINPTKDFTFIHLQEFHKRISDNSNLDDLGFGKEKTIAEELRKSIRMAFENEEAG